MYLFSKTPNRRGTQSCAEKLSNLVLSSHLDPIGEQNDVQYLSIFLSILINILVNILVYTYIHIYIYYIYIYGWYTLVSIYDVRNISTNIGHRSGHQSGLDESSGPKSTIILHGIAFHIYLRFSNTGKNILLKSKVWSNMNLFCLRGMSIFKKTVPATRRSQRVIDTFVAIWHFIFISIY